MVEPMCQMLQESKNSGKLINNIRCDDGMENKALKQSAMSSDWNLKISFDFLYVTSTFKKSQYNKRYSMVEENAL
jgi:hypothetical protein